MGLGNLFNNLFGSGGPSSAQVNVQNDINAVNQANAENALIQQKAAEAAAAARPAIANSVQQQMNSLNQANQQAALGVLNYIHTTSQGLLNNPKNSGRLTILGN